MNLVTAREGAEDRPERHCDGTLRALAAYGLPAAAVQLPLRPLAAEAWSSLLAGAAEERLLGLLGTAVDDGMFPVNSAQRHELARLRRQVLARCLDLEANLLRVTSLLGRTGVRTRVLKGPATAALDYDDPALRSFVDIDLLVRSDDFDVAVDLLAQAGFRRRYPEPRPGFDRRFGKGATLDAPNGWALDLHRTFVMGPFGFDVVLDDLWATSHEFQIAGQLLEALRPEARLMHACYHAILGDWPRRLVPHRDIAQLLSGGQCDAAEVVRLAERWNGKSILALGIRSTLELLAIDPGTRLSSWAKRVALPARDIRAVAVYERGQLNYAALSLSVLPRIPRLAAKVAFMRALVFPDAPYVRDHHPSAPLRLISGARRIHRGVRR